jgi:nicotinamidase-related amidase
MDIAHTALLAMDCQAGIVAAYAQPAEDFIGRAVSALHAARTAGMPVVHVQVGFRPGLPEISPRNKLFAALNSPEWRKFMEGPLSSIHPALGPEPADIVVTKHRVSAFTGTDLEMILSAKDIGTLVLFGIATSGVVLSTLLHASDADYEIVVIADCCADRDYVLHKALVENLFPRRALVLTSSEFADLLKNG